MFRAALFCIGIIAAFFFSPIVTLCAAVVLSVRYRAWEVPLLGLLVDLLWSPAGTWWYVLPWATITAILIVWLAEPLRSAFLSR